MIGGDDLFDVSDVSIIEDGSNVIDMGMDVMTRILDPESKLDLSRYQSDPESFVKDVLGIRKITADQISVLNSARDNVVTIVKSATGVGKTFIGGCLAVWAYKAFPRVQVYTAAAPPERNLKRLLWGEIRAIVHNNRELFKEDRITSLYIRRSPKDHIEGLTIPSTGTEKQREAKFSGKHHEVLFFIIDEGDAVPDEVYRAIEGCMSGGHVRLIIFYNPKIKQGEVYRKVKEKRGHVIEMSAINHPNVRSGKDIIPGAVTQEVTVKRVNEWSVPLIGDEDVGTDCFEVPTELIGVSATADNGTVYPPLERGFRKVTVPEMFYKVFGQYAAEGDNQLVSQKYIDDARNRWDLYVAENGEVPPLGIAPRMGVDIAEYGIDSNAAVFRWGGWVSRVIKWSGIDPDTSAEKAASLYMQKVSKRCSVCNFTTSGADAAQTGKDHFQSTGHRLWSEVPKAFVDAIGVGAGVPVRMTKLGCRDVSGIKVSSVSEGFNDAEDDAGVDLALFDRLRDELYWAIRVWLMHGLAMLPPDDRLLSALEILTYHETPKGKISVMKKREMRRILGFSPDELDALALTFASSSFDLGQV